MTTPTEPGHVSPISGLSHVQLQVSDVRASAKWYSAALGLVPFVVDPDIGYVALRHRGAKFVVVLTEDPRLRDGSHAPTNDLLDHLAFAVPDGDSLDAWAKHLTEIGIAHAGVALEDAHPSLQLRDPDGIAIEMVAP